MSGLRNEPARTRHRNELKEKYSLTSVPKGELEISGGPIGRKLSLSNHFGWVVLGKSKVGDGIFPHLSEFYEKPDPQGRDFQKVTYVLFMGKGAVMDRQRQTEMKQTQTMATGAEGEPQIVVKELIREKKDKPPKKKETRRKSKEHRKRSKSDESAVISEERTKGRKKIGEKKRKVKGKYLISEFYYMPKEGRSLSRSTRGTSGDESTASGKGKKKKGHRSRSRSSKKTNSESEDKKKKKRKPRSSRSSKSSGESDGDGGKKRRSRSRSKASSGADSKGKRKKKPKRRGGPDRWQLRAPAGAENFEVNDESEYTTDEENSQLNPGKLIYATESVKNKTQQQFTDETNQHTFGNKQYHHVAPSGRQSRLP